LKTNNNISLYNVKQVEIIRGPGSALYGSNAFLGVINVLTDKTLNEVSLSAGNFQSTEAYVAARHAILGWDIAASGRFASDDGDHYNILVDVPSSDFRHTQDPRTDIDFSLSIANHVFSADIRRSERRQEDFIQFGAVDDSVNYADEISTSVSVSYKLLDQGDWKWSIKAAYVEDETDNSDLIFDPGAAQAEGFFDVGVMDKAIGGELIEQNHLTIDVDGGWQSGNNQLLFGASYLNEEVERAVFQANFDTVQLFAADEPFPLTPTPSADASGPIGVNGSISRHVNSLYIQNKYRGTLAREHDLEFTLGVRYDDYSDFGSNVSPRLALVYNATDETTIKLMYGEAFRAPSFREQTELKLVFKGNPNLGAEKIKTYELSYIQQFSRLQTGITYFESKISDGIELSSGTDLGRVFTTPVNSLEMDLSGVEAEITASLGPLLIRAALTKLIETEENPTQVSTETASLSANYLSGKFNYNLSAYYHSEVEARPDQSGVGYSDLDRYSLLNFTGRYKWADEFFWVLRLKNLLNEDYQTLSTTDKVATGGIPSRGRTLAIGVEVKW